MARMPKAVLKVGLPKGDKDTNNGMVIEFKHGEHQTQLALDMADALRDKGYVVAGHILKELEERL